jgi:hypothetical protein
VGAGDQDGDAVLPEYESGAVGPYTMSRSSGGRRKKMLGLIVVVGKVRAGGFARDSDLRRLLEVCSKGW